MTALTLAATPALALHIMLDPGHGGIDTGAVYGSAQESDLVLKVAHRLKILLDADPQFKASITRTTNINLSLPARVKMAEGQGIDLFVSLHANAAADKRAKGVEFFFQNHLPPDEETLFLASQENQMLSNHQEILEISGGDEPSKKGDVQAIIEDLNRQHRMHSSLAFSQTLTDVWNEDSRAAQATIKQAPFYVISRTSMPSVLIEIGFLTNPKELKDLMNSNYQKDLAQKIYGALQAYREKMDRSSSAKVVN